MKPEFRSRNFKQILEENSLRRINYHDLRHSNASLLVVNHVLLKQIQEWLGHSDFSITATICAHLDAAAKQKRRQLCFVVCGLVKPKIRTKIRKRRNNICRFAKCGGELFSRNHCLGFTVTNLHHEKLKDADSILL